MGSGPLCQSEPKRSCCCGSNDRGRTIRMHVLVTADTLGGVWTFARELVTGLHARGHRVTLVSFGDIPTAEQSAWIAALPRIDFRPTAFRLEWMRDAEADLAASAEYLVSV